MKSSSIVSVALGGLMLAGSLGGTATIARADEASTLTIAAGAAAIVGALLTDNSGHSYYVRGNQRHYVSHDQAMYYRNHRGNMGGGMGRGGMNQGNMNRGDMHGGNMHGDQNHR
jgi:hypothetical protein